MSDPSLRFDVPGHKLICSMCFEWVDFNDLYVDPNGDAWDVCQPCGKKDEMAKVFLFMTEGRRNNRSFRQEQPEEMTK